MVVEGQMDGLGGFMLDVNGIHEVSGSIPLGSTT